MACGCLPLINADGGGICAYVHIRCSELISCANNNRTCYRSDYLCVNHPRCQSAPLCYSVSMAFSALCPPSPGLPEDGICANATWNQTGITVAGGNGEGSALNQFWEPFHIFVDEAHSLYVADWGNNRVTKWQVGANEGVAVAVGNGDESDTNQLSNMKYSRMTLFGRLIARQSTIKMKYAYIESFIRLQW